MQTANLQDPKFIAQHAQLREALKSKGIASFYANKTAEAILTGQVTDKVLGHLFQALDAKD